MALITISADDVRVVKRSDMNQFTAPAGEAVNAGQYCRFNTSTGKFEYGKATSEAEIGNMSFIAEKTVAIGDALTGLGEGTILEVGNALSGLGYGALVYLGDTDGRLADAAGTVAFVAGVVVPGWAGTAKKLLKLTFKHDIAALEARVVALEGA